MMAAVEKRVRDSIEGGRGERERSEKSRECESVGGVGGFIVWKWVLGF